MVDGRLPMELPAVPGSVRPPVDIPVFELSGWVGPRWVLIYQGKERLEQVTLSFGEVGEDGDARRRVDVTTHAKLPQRQWPGGAFSPATSFASIASGTLILLVERAIARLPEGKPRENRRRKLDCGLARAGAFTIMSEELPAEFWSSLELLVDGSPTAGFLATLPDCWAMTVDVGPAYVSASGNGAPPARLELGTVTDLRLYRMPGLSEKRCLLPPACPSCSGIHRSRPDRRPAGAPWCHSTRAVSVGFGAPRSPTRPDASGPRRKYAGGHVRRPHSRRIPRSGLTPPSVWTAADHPLRTAPRTRLSGWRKHVMRVFAFLALGLIAFPIVRAIIGAPARRIRVLR